MIVFLREKFIAQIFMWIIAVAFVIGSILLYSSFSGNSSVGRGNDEVVLKINGAKVGRGEFERLVSSEIQRLQAQNQGRLSIEQEEIEQQVIDQLIGRQVLLSSIQISDAEIDSYLRKSFLLDTYNATERQDQRDAIRQYVRSVMTNEALRNQIEGLELITDTEVENEYRLQNDKAKLKYIAFHNDEYNSAVEVEDAEVEAYFEENKEKYKIADRINLRFIKLDPKDFVSEDDVHAYYDVHSPEFTTPEVVKARHILKKFADDATDEQKAETRAQAEELLEKVKAETEEGVDFAELSEKYSEDTYSAANGGALKGRHPKLPPGDYFARGDMVPPFEKACFEELQPGETSDLIETQFGYHIIKLEERKPEEIQSFDLAKGEIESKLIQIKGVDKAKTIADDLLYDVEIQGYEEAVTLDRYKELSLALQDTGLFSRDASEIPEIGGKWKYSGLIDTVFNMEVDVSDVIETKKSSGEIEAYFVAKVLEKKASGFPALEDIWTATPKRTVKEQVIDDIKKEKVKQMSLEDAQGLYGLRNGDESLEELVKKYNAPEEVARKEREVQESNLFALSPTSDSIPGMGPCREAMFAAFNMELNEVRGPLQGDTATYIIQLVEREEPDMEKFENDSEEKIKVRRTLLQSKKSQLYNNWYNTLKKQVEIIDTRARSS